MVGTENLMARISESLEMLKDGYQENLTPAWHSEVMRQGSIDLAAARRTILDLSQAVEEAVAAIRFEDKASVFKSGESVGELMYHLSKVQTF